MELDLPKLKPPEFVPKSPPVYPPHIGRSGSIPASSINKYSAAVMG